jgi:proteasome lid subunit RPN8/RPN11
MKLILPRALQARIEAEARIAYPGECCGLMEGAPDSEALQILALHPTRNIAPAQDRFEIHPEDHFAALKCARARGHVLVGCYHSHPGGAPLPSQTDLAGAGENDFLWLIAALAQADAPVRFGAFAYRGAAFEPVALSDADGADLVTSSEKLES